MKKTKKEENEKMEERLKADPPWISAAEY